MTFRILAAASAVSVLAVSAAVAQDRVEVQFWHAMGGQLGERVDQFAADFNAMQDAYEVVPVYQGNYTETMTTAIAAFRAGEQPHIVQVFEVGTATMMAAEENGADLPGLPADGRRRHRIRRERLSPRRDLVLHRRPMANLLSLPFNSSTPVLWYNKTKLEPNWASMCPKPGPRSGSRGC